MSDLDYIDRALRDELRIINRHLPYTRPTLSEVIGKKLPHVVLRDGSIHFFNTGEIEYLASITPKELWDKLRLPIILEVNPSYGEGAIIIRDPIAAMVIARILDIEKPDKQLIIYTSQLVEVRRRLRTTTTIMFMIGSPGGRG
ncbi:MAG: DUF61 family protein [Desulfurococcales archaeon]|nr:DUF61 family protein [Desulfurococcales archaeon]